MLPLASPNTLGSVCFGSIQCVNGGFLHGSLVAQEAGLIWCHNPRMQDLLRPSTIWREGVAPFFLV